jgi:hypothetical protein
MKTFLSLMLVLVFAGTIIAQPPRDGRGKFGAGEGQFGDPAKMAEMRDSMRQRWQDSKLDTERVPGPPPWAGQGMRMGGQRGPQNPFLGRCPQSFSPKEGVELRGRDPKSKVSIDNIDNRGRGRKFDNKSHETQGYGSKSKKPGSNNKVGKVIVIHIHLN